MIITITDHLGESVFDGVLRASFDAATRRVTFLDPTGIETRGISVDKGTVTIIDRGVVIKRWLPDAAPTPDRSAN